MLSDLQLELYEAYGRSKVQTDLKQIAADGSAAAAAPSAGPAGKGGLHIFQALMYLRKVRGFGPSGEASSPSEAIFLNRADVGVFFLFSAIAVAAHAGLQSSGTSFAAQHAGVQGSDVAASQAKLLAAGHSALLQAQSAAATVVGLRHWH